MNDTPQRMLATLGLALATGLGVTFFSLPLIGIGAEAPWRETFQLIGSARIHHALWLSFRVSSLSLLLSLVFGFPLAWVIARTRFPGRSLLRTLLTLPMVLPPVVAGLGLLAAFGDWGLIGGSLNRHGITLPFTTLAAILAATFVAAPFLIHSLEAALQQTEPRLEQVATTLGASRTRVFFTVVLPQIRPSLLTGLALCWARALGEFGATISFAGNLEGRTQTVPLAIYQLLQTRPDEGLLLGAILLATSVLVLVGLRGWRPLV